jgi:hypothetical protein
VEEFKEIPLTGKKGAGLITKVSPEDYEWLSQYKISLSHGYGFAARKIDGVYRSFFVHRAILNAPKGKQVDHINHDLLDNRRENLRLVSQQQNQWNMRTSTGRSKYKGVIWNKQKNRWMGLITLDGKTKYLGLFHDEWEAAQAYNKAAKELFGEYAYVNQR